MQSGHPESPAEYPLLNLNGDVGDLLGCVNALVYEFSGSYFPRPVRAVLIPKKTGGECVLGVPTVSDRIAQMVAKLTFEPHFVADSYGYRPGKSALDAVGVTRRRCWDYA